MKKSPTSYELAYDPDEDVEALPDDMILTSHRVANLLHASPSAVISWFDQGKLIGFRTPGGHRRVRVAELRQFLASHGMPIPRLLGSDQSDPPARVFIVDDHEPVTRSLRRALTLAVPGIEVTGCTDGVEALLRIGANPPDLVLLDIYMVSLNGFEVCTRLRQIPELSHVRVVGMSGHPSPEDRDRILACGAEGYLEKPLTAAQVLEFLPQTKGRVQ